MAKKTSYSFYRKHLKKLKNETSLETVTVKEKTQFLIHNDDHSEFEFISLISCLSQVEQEIIIKKIAFGFTHAEISKQLDIPEGTIRWKYQQILDKLEKKITEEKDSS